MSRSLNTVFALFTYTGLACVTLVLGETLGSVLINSSTNQASQCVAFGLFFSGWGGMAYTFIAFLYSSDRQLVAFHRDRRRKLVALAQVIGVYCAELLLWFSASKFGANFWHSGSSGWAWFMGLLTTGALLALIGLMAAYHQTIWPRGPHPAD